MKMHRCNRKKAMKPDSEAGSSCSTLCDLSWRDEDSWLLGRIRQWMGWTAFSWWQCRIRKQQVGSGCQGRGGTPPLSLAITVTWSSHCFSSTVPFSPGRGHLYTIPLVAAPMLAQKQQRNLTFNFKRGDDALLPVDTSVRKKFFN